MKNRFASWDTLEDELNQWDADGKTATFWWRDDDLTTSGIALDRLLSTTQQYSIRPALASIPALVQPGLARVLGGSHVHILQHGYAHQNHSTGLDKKAEYGPHRSVDCMIDELKHGREILLNLFSERFLSVLVPPWNRYDEQLILRLEDADLIGLSAMWARAGVGVNSRVLQVNTHIDPVAWRDDRGFTGLAIALEQLVSHLRLRREYSKYASEPTGLLTHHLDHNEDVWTFCAQLANFINEHPAARWIHAGSIWSNTAEIPPDLN